MIDKPTFEAAGLVRQSTIAAELEVTTKTLRNWERDRGFPAPVTVGRGRWYSREKVAEWLRGLSVGAARAA